MSDFIKITHKELKTLRKKIHTDQNSICPILKLEFSIDEMVIDHKHKKASEEIGENGAGLIRGCIHRQVNSFEGKVTNAYKRYGLDKFGVSLPDLLRNLADYLEQYQTNYIHPTEIKKEPKLKKSSYNKLKKIHLASSSKRKFPEYPKSGKLTKKLEEFYKIHDLRPEFYKN